MRRSHFGALTERMQAFREEVLDEKPYVDAERAILATEAYKASLNQPRVMARALMLKNILEKMTIYLVRLLIQDFFPESLHPLRQCAEMIFIFHIALHIYFVRN